MATKKTLRLVELWLALGSFLCLAPTLLTAATRTVTSTNDSGTGSLRQVLAPAVSGDTIDFGVTGTITLTSGQINIATNLTISGPGAALLTVSGNDASRIFQVNGGTVLISGLTFTKGRTTGAGGAILNSGGILTVSRCVLSSNYAALEGGSMRNASTTRLLTVSECFIYSNRTDQGGGAMCSAGPLTVSKCTIYANRATFSAGAL